MLMSGALISALECVLPAHAGQGCASLLICANSGMDQAYKMWLQVAPCLCGRVHPSLGEVSPTQVLS